MKYIPCAGNKTRAPSFVLTICFLTCAAVTAFGSRANAMTEARADELAPGSYVWSPSLATDGALSMRVNLASQSAYVYRGDTLIGVTTIASGRRGYETPNGTFSVLEKERFHHSNKYDNAPMPYMQRLSWSGLALHGGHPHGYPASHGCIRLPMGFAAALFKEATRGMQVVITGHAQGRRQTMIASRQRTRTRVQSDDLSSAEFSNGQDELQAAPEVPDIAAAPATQSAPVYGAPNGEADDQRNYGDESGDTYYYRDRGPEDERYNGYSRRSRERERAPELPPDDLPPPPG